MTLLKFIPVIYNIRQVHIGAKHRGLLF